MNDVIKLRLAIKTYLKFKRPSTVRSFETIFSQLGGQQRLLELKPLEATRWISGLIDRGLSSATVRQRINLLSGLGNYLVHTEVILKNPWLAARHALPRGQNMQVRPTAFICFSLVKKFYNAPDRRTAKGVAHRALLALLFGGAMRRSEVRSLNVGDFVTYGSAGIAVVIRHPKSQTQQEQVLPTWARERFAELISLRKSQGAKESDPAFLNTRGKRIGDRAIYRIFTHYAKCLGIKAAPHSARATTATKYLIDNPGDLFGLKKLLRHKSIHSGAVYDKRFEKLVAHPGRSIRF